jgi:hypothetical protein
MRWQSVTLCHAWHSSRLGPMEPTGELRSTETVGRKKLKSATSHIMILLHNTATHDADVFGEDIYFQTRNLKKVEK